MKDLSVCRHISSYWNWRAVSFDSTSCRHEPWVDIYSRVLSLPAGSKVLDAGTGTGFLALGLAGQGFKVTGIDISSRMLDIASKKAARMGLEVKFMQAGADDPPFAPGTMDAIVTRNLIWTLKDPWTTLRNWSILLRPGGRLVISDGMWRPVTLLQRVSSFMLEGIQKITGKGASHPEKFKQMYKKVDPDLPFGAGLYASQASELLVDCGFSSIVSHEHEFDENPYTANGKCFPGYGRFFILSATCG
ncbi:class I SAM-dependent methyltransferase [Desulfonatronovibrio hydrogenovorans]|uniref:class I SAM-dependent methyltransferase n=1 Tax=Desulfonatronovibrio hydrogenovorans TaxID=53245 RepID=UPI00068CC3E6|nr:class I SAM-dependent methyltransferase [Desulfonatronovibrio hydrogenovorans]